MRILTIALFLISFSAMCQTQEVDTLKVNAKEAEKLNQINRELKNLEDARKQIQYLESMKLIMLESAFNYNNKPVPQRKEYIDGMILYIKDEEK